MISLTSQDLRNELDKTDVAGISLRYFLKKVLNRMIELEDFITDLQNQINNLKMN